MTRTSTSCVSVEPTGRTVFSCSTRSSFTCSAGGMSPISSSSSVPRLAVRNSPLWSRVAPVKEPLTCPNSSDSSSCSGIALQLIPTNAWSRRGLDLWMARASSSLPVPDSPKMKTLASLSATSRAFASTSSIAGLRVMISARHPLSSPSAPDAAPPLSASARSTSTSSALASNGLVR